MFFFYFFTVVIDKNETHTVRLNEVELQYGDTKRIIFSWNFRGFPRRVERDPRKVEERFHKILASRAARDGYDKAPTHFCYLCWHKIDSPEPII